MVVLLCTPARPLAATATYTTLVIVVRAVGPRAVVEACPPGPPAAIGAVPYPPEPVTAGGRSRQLPVPGVTACAASATSTQIDRALTCLASATV